MTTADKMGIIVSTEYEFNVLFIFIPFGGNSKVEFVGSKASLKTKIKITETFKISNKIFKYKSDESIILI